MAEDMVIFTRTFDLLEWLLPKSERFPRAYRSTATQRLMDAALDLQEALVEAQTREGALAGVRLAQRRCGARPAADLSAPGSPLALAQRWSVRARGQQGR